MVANPDPRRITAEHWRFIEECKALEPTDTGDLYPYADKPGYHNTRKELKRDGLTDDYSIRLKADQVGPDWATAAWDWVSKKAQHGDHSVINKYARRIRDAYVARDPRLKGWREALTQVDSGKAEGFNFNVNNEGGGWYTRVPDLSHDFHTHFSKLRKYLSDWITYAGMLSILAGESLDTWKNGQSKYLATEEENMTQDQFNTLLANNPDFKQLIWRVEGLVKRRPDVTGGTLAHDENVFEGAVRDIILKLDFIKGLLRPENPGN